MAPPVLSLQNCFLTFGGTPLLEDASLFASAGERICIVGRNGSGKSTLMKVAAGLVDADSGKRFLQPGATLRYLPQEPDFGVHRTVAAYVEAGLAPGDDPHRARLLLEELGLTGDENPVTLSGGEGRRAALARTLAPEPDILLLDEPTNHLDIDVIEWLEHTLRRIKSALLLISHDRRFLASLSRSTIWLDRGKTRRIDIGFGDFEAWRDEALAQEELDRHKLARKIEREGDWLRYGVTARRKRNVKRLSDLHALREKHRTDMRAPGQVKLAAAETALSGKLVIEAKTITKAFPPAAPVVDRFSARIFRADRLGIIGPNGAGKTTLVNLLTGKLEPDTGSVRLGTNLDIASLEQGRDTLTPDMTVADALTGGGGDAVVINGHPKHVAAYMQDFLFSPEQIRTPVKVLSGGERARLMLARALAKPSNLLVLDEPTNDLDIETLDVLEDMLSGYEGTVILISHDRDFLDRVVTSVIAPDGGGRWIEYAGGYSDMLAQRGHALAPKGAVETKAAPTRAPHGKTANGQKPKRRLNPNEQHALATLPARIAKLEEEMRKLQTAISDPSLYLKNRASFEEASAGLAKVQSELAVAETRWLELEMLRENLAR